MRLAAEYVTLDNHSGVVVWDVLTRKRLVEEPLSLKGQRTYGVSFSPDGTTLAVGAFNGVALWDLDLEAWKRRASRIANRNFTREEWREYLPDVPYRATFPDLPVPAAVTPK